MTALDASILIDESNRLSNYVDELIGSSNRDLILPQHIAYRIKNILNSYSDFIYKKKNK